MTYTRALKVFYRISEIAYRFQLGFKRFAKLRSVRPTLPHTKLLVPTRKIASRFLNRMNRRVLFALLVLVCVFSSVGIIIGSQWSSVTIRSGGNLKVLGVGVYKDMDCSKPVDFLDWGTLEPDSAKSITLYIRNEGSYAAALFMTVNNWNPSIASSYMSLSWNYDGEMLAPMETVEVILTLSVSKDVENIVDFSLDVTIKISE